MADQAHLEILKHGTDAWNEWRENNQGTSPKLSEIDFSGDFVDRADFSGINLSGAYLDRADLRWADLRGANLNMADLRGANLSFVDLRGADLSSANLNGTIFERAILQETTLTNVDLAAFVNVEIIHRGRSVIDDRSIAKSLRCKNLLSFLVATGMPLTFATYAIDSIRALDPNSLFNLMHSTFISYGGSDEGFASKLQESLHTNGVTTFLFKKDAVPGQALSNLMRNQVRENDRIVLVCSENSLNRSGVLNEIELTLHREAREGGHTLLIPITVDRYVFDDWKPQNQSLKEAVLERVIADFIGADIDQSKFDGGIGRLLKALRIAL